MTSNPDGSRSQRFYQNEIDFIEETLPNVFEGRVQDEKRIIPGKNEYRGQYKDLIERGVDEDLAASIVNDIIKSDFEKIGSDRIEAPQIEKQSNGSYMFRDTVKPGPSKPMKSADWSKQRGDETLGEFKRRSVAAEISNLSGLYTLDEAYKADVDSRAKTMMKSNDKTLRGNIDQVLMNDAMEAAGKKHGWDLKSPAKKPAKVPVKKGNPEDFSGDSSLLSEGDLKNEIDKFHKEQGIASARRLIEDTYRQRDVHSETYNTIIDNKVKSRITEMGDEFDHLTLEEREDLAFNDVINKMAEDQHKADKHPYKFNMDTTQDRRDSLLKFYGDQVYDGVIKTFSKRNGTSQTAAEVDSANRLQELKDEYDGDVAFERGKADEVLKKIADLKKLGHSKAKISKNLSDVDKEIANWHADWSGKKSRPFKDAGTPQWNRFDGKQSFSNFVMSKFSKDIKANAKNHPLWGSTFEDAGSGSTTTAKTDSPRIEDDYGLLTPGDDLVTSSNLSDPAFSEENTGVLSNRLSNNSATDTNVSRLLDQIIKKMDISPVSRMVAERLSKFVPKDLGYRNIRTIDDGSGNTVVGQVTSNQMEVVLFEMLKGRPSKEWVDTFLHESTHAAVISIMKRAGDAVRGYNAAGRPVPSAMASRREKKFYGQMERLYGQFMRATEGSNLYARENIDEFVAEAFSNKEVQDILKGLPSILDRSENAYTGFVRAISKVLGFREPNALLDVFNVADNFLVSGQERAADSGKVFQDGIFSKLEGTGMATENREGILSDYSTELFDNDAEPSSGDSFRSRPGDSRERMDAINKIADFNSGSDRHSLDEIKDLINSFPAEERAGILDAADAMNSSDVEGFLEDLQISTDDPLYDVWLEVFEGQTEADFERILETRGNTGEASVSDVLADKVDPKEEDVYLNVKDALRTVVPSMEGVSPEFQVIANRLGGLVSPKLRTHNLGDLNPGEAGVYQTAIPEVGIPEHISLEVTDDNSTWVSNLLHESTHAAVERILAKGVNGKPMSRKERKLFNDVNSVYNRFLREGGNSKGLDYAKVDIREFVSEAMSNSEVQKALSNMSSVTSKTAWTEFVSSVARALGIKNVNALTEVMSLTEDIALLAQEERMLEMFT